MSSLKELERDVHQFLAHLAHVRKVEVEASINRGKKRVEVTTVVDCDNSENRKRVTQTELHIMDRHSNVTFDFTLKEEHVTGTLGAA